MLVLMLVETSGGVVELLRLVVVVVVVLLVVGVTVNIQKPFLKGDTHASILPFGDTLPDQRAPSRRRRVRKVFVVGRGTMLVVRLAALAMLLPLLFMLLFLEEVTVKE